MKFLSWTGLQYFYSKYIGNLNEQLKNVKESIGNFRKPCDSIEREFSVCNK